MNALMNDRLRTTTLIDCIAATPCAGAMRARAGITKLENAKKTPATSPEPSAAQKVKTATALERAEDVGWGFMIISSLGFDEGIMRLAIMHGYADFAMVTLHLCK